MVSLTSEGLKNIMNKDSFVMRVVKAPDMLSVKLPPLVKDPDDVDIVREGWSPSEKTFNAFLSKDEQFALSNVKMLLMTDHTPLTAREIKDYTLHCMDTVERVLTTGVASGLFSIAQGKYSWKIPSKN